MKEQNNLKKSALRVTMVTGVLLLIPLTAKLFFDEMMWSPFDFVVAGILFFGTGMAYVLVSRQSNSTMYRVAVGVSLFSALFLFWANVAVGIIGSEDNAGNLMYFGVEFILVIGAFIARFRPRGMAFTLFVTAFAQAVTIIIALIAGMQYYPYSSVYEIIMVNGFFVTLFSISGGLFWQVGDRKLNQ